MSIDFPPHPHPPPPTATTVVAPAAAAVAVVRMLARRLSIFPGLHQDFVTLPGKCPCVRPSC